ncbi:MAG TPA: nucleoside hydrolase [Albitalea sp.]|uniref:nucleoside hydrolase n=1 Tax=Piscinibacter sp. TaxID=1903157 RepID=UPI002ED47D05
MKILFDTDPGVDDAMALLMLARDPRARLVGITTVYGNASIDTTTSNALALCERFKIDVPVARGAAKALVRPVAAYPEMVHGRNGMGDVALAPAAARREESHRAERFIARMARRHSGDLVLVAVGPLTNIALALEHDPDIVEHVRAVVVMGGAFGVNGHAGNVSPVAEANVFNDPHAADQVFSARWPVTIVGLDVTHEVLLDTAYLDAVGRDGGAEGAFIRDITRGYEEFYNRQTGGGIYSHDASAVACALDASPFKLRRGPVRAVTGGIAMGQTIQAMPDSPVPAIDWAGRPQQSVCVDVDASRLRADFRTCFVGK